MIRLLARGIEHYEGLEEETPGTVLEVGKQLVETARMLSALEHSRSMLRIEAQRKERDLYLGKSDVELVKMCLAVPELRRLVIERVAIEAPELLPQRKELGR